MAHAIFAAEAKRRKLRVNVVSAGTLDFHGAMAVRDARLICDQRQTPMPKFISTCITSVDLSSATRVFVMERSHVDSVIARGIAPERISILGEFDPQNRGPEIEDPMGEDAVAFEQCYSRLRDCIIGYLDTTTDFDRIS
jgi:protein-tyrosine-phosphatase